MDSTEYKKDTANFVWSDNFRRTTNISCPECGALLICDESRVLTSNPPMHWYYCPECREFQMNASSDTNLQAYIPEECREFQMNASSDTNLQAYIPEACRSCMNHPSNGGSGICHCTLGSPSVTCNSIDGPGR